MDNNYKTLIDTLSEWNIELTEYQINQFDQYYKLLIDWNNKMNLTAITDFDDVIKKHFIDSVSTVQFIDFNSYDSLIDVGTGAGFPGIPLKILFPHLKITLLDSLNKRLNFLNEVIDKLNLSDIKTLHGRAEDLAHDKLYREKYDLCLSRAVANLSTLTELCTPFIKVGGLFVAYKSEKAESEILSAKKALHLLGCKLNRTEHFILFDNERNIVIVDKLENASKQYPRKAGTPAKNPLGSVAG